MKHPLLCIETLKIIKKPNRHQMLETKQKKKKKRAKGLHYRYITQSEIDSILKGEYEEIKKLNTNYLVELYADTEFYYCVENNVAFDSIKTVSAMLGEKPKEFKENLGNKNKDLTFVLTDSCFIYNNHINVIRA